MNTVHLVGKIATNINVKEYPSKSGGEAMTKAAFLMVVPADRKNGEPDWVRVEVWNGQATNLVRFNRKGSRISVTGRLGGWFYNPEGGERGGTLRTVVVAKNIDYLSPPQTGVVAEVETPASEPRKAVKA